MKTKLKKISVGKGIMFLCLALVAICCVYPFLIVLGSSFQSQSEITSVGYKVIPDKPTLAAYTMIFKNSRQILDSYLVTALTTFISTVVGLILTSTFAYVIARQDYKYRRVLSFYVFFTMLFNGGMVPMYIMISKWMHLSDTIWALILPGLCTSWNILMMKGFFSSIPTSIIEAAKLDGAGEFRTFAQIIIPISKPAFATIGLFILLAAWNEWQNSLLYIESEHLIKLQYLLQRVIADINFFNSADALKYGLVSAGTEIPTYSARMAMCVIACGPIVLIFPFFQKYFVKGMTVGSVKG